MTLEQLAAEITTIYSDIKEGLDRSPEGLLQELDNRCQWLARSAEIKADVQFLRDQARGVSAEKHLKLSATVFKAMIEKETATEEKVLELADRLNATITHQIDAIRSILSFEKEIRRTTPGGH